MATLLVLVGTAACFLFPVSYASYTCFCFFLFPVSYRSYTCYCFLFPVIYRSYTSYPPEVSQGDKACVILEI